MKRHDPSAMHGNITPLYKLRAGHANHAIKTRPSRGHGRIDAGHGLAIKMGKKRRGHARSVAIVLAVE